MIRFAENLNKMITAGLGGATEAPRTEVAVGHRICYLEASGPVASFETNIAVPIKKLLVDMLPVQAGSGDPSPENIRPITGREIVTVWREASYNPSAEPALTIQLGQTVYGGTADFTTGTMTVTHALKIYDGTQPWSLYPGANGFSIGIAEMLSGYRQFGISNWLRNLRTANDGLMPSFWLGVNNHTLYVLNISSLLSEYTNEAWYTYLAEHPLQIYIPLATPLEITLDPVTLSTLKGDNNVWSDAGNISLEYLYYEETEGY